jgi:NAD(P)H-hydrate repair Nnr-like enzyme with NAD(P)H-hydrate epimerase domain
MSSRGGCATAGSMSRSRALGEPKAGAAATMRRRWDGPVVTLAEAEPRPMLVDGLFGTGMTRALDREVAARSSGS